MIYLTTAGLAGIRGCSVQYIKKIIKDGKIKAEKSINDKNRPVYKIPITELSDKEQLKYYTENSIDVPVELLPKKAEKKQVITEYEQLSDQQRQQVADWIRILDDWQKFVLQYDGSKVDATAAFVATSNYNGYKISPDILYRKQRIYKSGNAAALADNRGHARRGISCIDPRVWQMFLYLFLSENQLPVQQCYEKVSCWCKQDYPDLLPLPSQATFRRHIGSDIPLPVNILGRRGEKAYKDLCGLYIKREYENMQSNDYWIADNHTFDVMVGGKNGKPKRMYLTAFMDARSGIFTGVYITDTPSSQATLYALRRGIKKYGIPKNIYVDNGREFLTFDVGGLGHRQKKSTKDKPQVPPVFARLGIDMTNAIVRNARAKTIERRFLDVKNDLSRLFDTYTGGNVLEKPEKLKQILKHEIIDEVAFTEIVEDMLNYYFNEQQYGGSVAADKGKTRNQVYYDRLEEKRIAADEDLYLMMLRSTRSQKVGRRGVKITVAGKKLDYYNDELLLHWQGKKVYVRYDPEDLSSVRVYDLDDKYITTAQADNKTIAAYGSNKDTIAMAMKEIRRQEKIVKDSLAAKKVVAFGERNALDIVLAEVEENKGKQQQTDNAVINIKRADEENYYDDYAVAAGGDTVPTVDINRMIQNAEKARKDE